MTAFPTPAIVAFAVIPPLLFFVVFVVRSTRALARAEAAFAAACVAALRPPAGGRAPAVLITGATSGIGLKLAELLACAGLRVLIGHRDLRKGRDALRAVHAALAARGLPPAGASLLELDVTSPESVRRAAEKLPAGGLDFVVLNAGVLPQRGTRACAAAGAVLRCRLGAFLETGRAAPGEPHFLVTEEGPRAHGAPPLLLATHVLGHALLLQLLRGALRPGARVLWSGSRAADLAAVPWAYLGPPKGGSAPPPPGWALATPPPLPGEAYAAAKAVQELVSRAAPRRLPLPPGVESFCVCPGFVETPLGSPPFFAALSPLFRAARALFPSMTLESERGCAVYLGVMAAGRGALQPALKYVLKGGGVAPAARGVVPPVGGEMEDWAWDACDAWLREWR
jgi:NAD(P)-dependent dehydrogenase (short-subunit alcohol dehydrogenase family)